MFRRLKKINARRFLYIFLVFSLQVFVTYLFLRYLALEDAKRSLFELSARIVNDLGVRNDRWDTTLYNADPFTPHPSGSNGFTAPLYIISTSGFVIERNQPISGLLDSSDFKHLSAFTKPQTIGIVTNDQWRIQSKLLTNKKNEIAGLISVAYHNPNSNIIEDIDQILYENIDKISSMIKINGTDVDISNVDIRKIRYDVTFEIVNIYNRVLLQNGRYPTYIDPSYVQAELKNSTIRVIKDSRTNERFLIYKQPIFDEERKLQGVILVSRSLEALNNILFWYVVFSLGISIFIITPLILLLFSMFKLRYKNHIDKYPAKVNFDYKESIITIDDKKVVIPYATNQYYLCKAIFSYPKKRWELDELLKKFGESESSENWRKVYDASNSINKKSGLKLISYHDKTFRLNPVLKVG